jgi:hypothetical protein
MHACMHACIPWIHKFVMATIGCGISHEDTKHTDNAATKQKQRTKMMKPHIHFQNTANITQKSLT